MPDLVWTANAGSQEELVFGDLGAVREILYGGQKGGGKSGAIPALALMHIAENPTHARVLILRETFGELDDLMDMMRSFCSAAGATWNEQKKTWSFPCGARLRFGHLGDGCRPYWGREFSLIIIDELTRCIATERDYTMLLGSLRNSKGVPCQVISMTNPGGPGHNWVKARFMAAAPRTIVTDDRTGLGRVFIPAALRENEHNLGPEYRQTLEMLPDAEREAYLNGDWDAFEGAVFRLTPGIHTWSWAQFRERTGQEGIPASWLRYRAYDHGLAAPGACYWIAVDHSGRAYAYRELYTVAKDSKGDPIPNKGAAYPPRDVAKMVATRSEGESYAGSWSGRDLFDATRRDHGGGQTLASHFDAEGIHFTAWTVGPGSRIAGKQALHQWLAVPADGDGFPGLVFIAEECPHALRTLPALEYSRTQPEQVDDTGEDHCFDALAGWAKMKPWAPRQAKEHNPLMEIRKRAGGGSWMSA
jgi:hypothetical protein